MYNLNFETHKDLLEKILIGDVILFTGAGFSMGAKVQGNNILSTDELMNNMIKDLLAITDLNEIERLKKKYSFQRLCQYCVNQAGEDAFSEFIVRSFKNTRPATFHHLYKEINWKDIFTLNVDDIIETIYNEDPQNIELQVINTQKQVESYRGDNILQYYKLHGDVNNKSEGFVFAKKQYLDKLTQKELSYPHLQFAQKIYMDTICFIGTNLDEVDLDFYIDLHGKLGSGLPKKKVYYISRTIHKEDIEEMGHRNIECIQETAESFITKVLEYKKLQPVHKSNIRIVKKTDPAQKIASLGFMYVPELIHNFDPISIQKHKPTQFYLGYEPTWMDIASSSDAILTSTDKLINDIEYMEAYTLFLLLGKTGNGKTTTLKRILYHFALNSDYLVFEHSNLTELNTFTISTLARTINNSTKKFIFAFDDGSWAINFAKKLYEQIDQKKVAILITSRIPEYYREMRIVTNIPSKTYDIDNPVDKENAVRIITCLENKGLLGELAKYTSIEEKVKQFISRDDRGKDIFSCLIKSTNGRGFEQRIDSIVNAQIDRDSMLFLYVLFLFDRFGSLGLSLQLFFNVFNKDIKDLHKIIRNCTDLLNKKIDNFLDLSIVLKPRGTYVSEKMYSKIKLFFTSEEMLNISKYILINIASTHQLKYKNRKNYYTEIMHLLLPSKLYINHLGIQDKKLFDDYYNSLKEYFKENEDFWLHYARMEMKLNDLDSAKIHLEQAEALNENSSNIQHSIGHWHLLKSLQYDDFSQAETEFSIGEKIMIERLGVTLDAYPVHTYIDSFIEFHNKFKFALTTSKIRRLNGYINKVRDIDPRHVLILIVWKKFYKFLEKNKQLNSIVFSPEELHMINKIDISKSAEEQYTIFM